MQTSRKRADNGVKFSDWRNKDGLRRRIGLLSSKCCSTARRCPAPPPSKSRAHLVLLRFSPSKLYNYYVWTRSDCCALAPILFGKLLKNSISRNYKITNKRLLLCAKELVQNVSLWSQVSQSMMVANERSQANWDFSCVRKYVLLLRWLRSSKTLACEIGRSRHKHCIDWLWISVLENAPRVRVADTRREG